MRSPSAIAGSTAPTPEEAAAAMAAVEQFLRDLGRPAPAPGPSRRPSA